MDRILGIDEVRKVLMEFYGLNYALSDRWAKHFVGKNADWNVIHMATNMAIYTNQDVENILMLYDAWSIQHTNQ